MRRDPLVELPHALAAPAPPSDARYVLGIDGGATKTLAAVLDLDRHEVHLAEGGPSNEDAVGAQRRRRRPARRRRRGARARRDRAARARRGRARGRRHRHGRDRTPGVLGAQRGVDRRQRRRRRVGGCHRRRARRRRDLGDRLERVRRGARRSRAGAWAVGGTCSATRAAATGWACKSIHAALADRDASGPETALTDAAPGFFGVDSVEALAALVYSKPLTKGEIAAFAVEACRLAESGDAVAQELYRRGASELAAQIVAVIRHTGLGSEEGEDGGAFPVGLIGSVFKAGPLFVEPLTTLVHEVAPRARVAVVEMAPVGGSLQLAARACGRAEAIDRERLTRSLGAAPARPQ